MPRLAALLQLKQLSFGKAMFVRVENKPFCPPKSNKGVSLFLLLKSLLGSGGGGGGGTVKLGWDRLGYAWGGDTSSTGNNESA